MEFEQFKREYVAARAEVDAGELVDVAAVRARLRELAAGLTADTDRGVAYGLIEQLGTAEAPDDQSPEMKQALHILDSTVFETGTTEERLAAIGDARRRIWALADRAGQDSNAIRALTRGLETTENLLTEGAPWDDQPGRRISGVNRFFD
ncbi:hypothetical protein [Kribbella shirazensis]|uniref:Mg2+ and Co2+ transporter CorA n=1 Tax=Kribbella shirazensis TaxID=1105143 RepID=A0A7X6A1A2_9ACTN|nr:hypothetical protein [Kribbella shirazensis]NIK58052.1 Mg2+ and Co2+ transporter CorA [Kribbella shirazensis]